MVISGQKGGDTAKIKVRPVLVKDRLMFQVTRHIGTQVFHVNECGDVLAGQLAEDVFNHFKQVQIRTKNMTISVMISKKGLVTIKKKQTAVQTDMPKLAHNRKKSYILEEGRPVPFLIDLGVMTEDGRVIQKRYDKFRQINRFLEFIEDILPQFDRNRELTIIDFGCGKSYLTFAMYYYMKVLKGYDIHIIGLDLKADVIRNCNQLKDKYGYEKLEFLHGDIADFEGVRQVDMVVTLHACDTATDYALYHAIRWKAKLIFSVPCCQHELNKQMKSDNLSILTRYGIVKERTAALMTDAIRGNLLTESGYRTQLLEFVDLSHTPKNLLIRAVRSMIPASAKKQARAEVDAIEKEFGLQPTLDTLLHGKEA